MRSADASNLREFRPPGNLMQGMVVVGISGTGDNRRTLEGLSVDDLAFGYWQVPPSVHC
jgi:hypothetical protein